MALTILQTPDSPNVSNTNLIYTVSSSNVPQFQYRYIADLYYSGSATKLARFKYPQNSSGTANIDLARPIGDYLGTDYNWKTIGEENPNLAKTFTIKFGEEYGTSYNSAVTTFADITSSSIQVSKGNIQYPSLASYDNSTNVRVNQSSSINFNYYPYISEAYGDGTLTNNPLLLSSNATTKYYNVNNPQIPTGSGVNSRVAARGAQPIGHDDYATETFYVSNGPSVTVAMIMYDDNSDVIWKSYLINNTGFNSSSLSSSNFTVNNLATIGTGVQNFQGCENDPTGPVTIAGPLSASISSSNQWNYYAIEVITGNGASPRADHFYYNEDKGPNVLLNTTASSYQWNNMDPAFWPNKFYPSYCNNEKTRFAFINSFGAWDYYNVYMPTRRVTNIDRKIYEQDRINLNDRIATYNVSNRGETQYYTEYTDDFEITTDIIDSQESQWLREMFESTDVFIQSGSDFIPINILNSQETIINNKARNKQFQYTITYQFSNLREPR